MPPALVAGDFTGDVEVEWILAALRTLMGGAQKVWDTAVPDDVDIPEDAPPYILLRAQAPSASAQGRNVATGEQGQPHLLTFSVVVIGSNVDDVNAVRAAARRLLIGKSPSLTSTPIRAKGGFTQPRTVAGTRPTRFEKAFFCATIVNF